MTAEHSGFSITLGIEKIVELGLKRFDEWNSKDRRQLSELLKNIVKLLEAVKKKLEQGKVPYRDGNALATLINSAARVAEKSRERNVQLALIFENELPKVGRLLRDADYFIDGKARDAQHFDVAVRGGKTTVDPKWDKIANACKEIERAIGKLSGFVLGIEDATRGRS